MILHAGLIAHRTPAGWRSVLIEGPSGAGKSALALSLAQQGWRLVADDRVLVWTSGGRPYGRAPEALHGLLEVRGVGVLTVPALRFAEISLALIHADEPDRMPEAAAREIAGVTVPALALNLRDGATPARLLDCLRRDPRSHGFALHNERRITPILPAGPRVPSNTP